MRMRNVLLMGVKLEFSMRHTEQMVRYDYLVTVAKRIVVVNKILMRLIFYLLFFSPPPGSSFVAGLSEKQVINLVWPYINMV